LAIALVEENLGRSTRKPGRAESHLRRERISEPFHHTLPKVVAVAVVVVVAVAVAGVIPLVAAV
jgi:hypothetical protein